MWEFVSVFRPPHLTLHLPQTDRRVEMFQFFVPPTAPAKFSATQVRLAIDAVDSLKSRFGANNIYRCMSLDNDMVRILIQTNINSMPSYIVHCAFNPNYDKYFPIAADILNVDNGTTYNTALSVPYKGN